MVVKGGATPARPVLAEGHVRHVGEAVAFMDAAPVSDEVRAMIYHRNAERLFGIPQE